MLADIASAGGGVYLRAGNINANLDEIVRNRETRQAKFWRNNVLRVRK